GLVSSATDNGGTVKKYLHDPHIDPYLSWAGKAEGNQFEVPTVSLHVHERVDPRRIVKSFMREQSGARQQSLFESAENQLPLNKAIEFYSHDQDWSNRLIAGDSLLVMNSLLQKEGMAGKIQMVYIDPPYGIKYNSNFQPFVSKPSVKEKDEDLPSEPETLKAFRDTWELEIHSYLTYLHDRLTLAQELLHPSGSIFFQISDQNLHHARELLDEAFGSHNFVAIIPFKKTTSSTTNLISTVNDYIVWYAKDITQLKYRQLYQQKAVGGDGGKQFTKVELPDGRVVDREEYEKLGLTDGKYFYIDNLQSASPGSKYWVELNGEKYYPRNYWKTDEAGMQNLIKAGRVVSSGKGIGYKRYFDDFPVYALNNFWEDTTASFQTRMYVVQTIPKVIERCILMSSDPGDIVLDPTCGSGTTACMAEKWGRRWITCDTSRVAITLAKQRVMTSSFDFFKLAHPDQGIENGFDYKKVPHITLGDVANNAPAQEEVLYDQPKLEKDKVRVVGPFTVEAVPCLQTKPFGSAQKDLISSTASIAREGETARYSHWCDELKASGIRAVGGNMLQFSRIEPLNGTKWLHAEGEILDSVNQTQKALISFGPDFGPLEQRQVEQAVQEAMLLQEKPSFLIFAAFHFDPEAAKDIDQMKFAAGSITILKAQMSVDLLTEDLRKKRSSNQSFWLIGQPDIEVTPDKKGMLRVKVNGFDYYNPVSGEIDSGGSNKIAMWMLDTDYDEQSLLPDQVFFPMQDQGRDWTKLMKTLNGAINEDIAETFTGVESLPFYPGPNRKIAVKIIDDRGIESFVVKSV
ncbi:site-specific DNA-methyltransferase, partial [Patescibacteria group bacterium]|nr:site-specific DNA-methyltransferase [Patescibacteria group bacterium]